MGKHLDLVKLKRETENEIIEINNEYGINQLKGEFIRGGFLISYRNFQIKVYPEGKAIMGSSIINIDFTNTPRSFHIKRINVDFSESEKNIILKSLFVIINYWIVRVKEGDIKGVLFVTKHTISKDFLDIVTEKIKNNYIKPYVDKTDRFLYENVLNHFKLASHKQILGFFVKPSLKNKIASFLSFIPILEKIKAARPFLCFTGEYGLNKGHFYELFDGGLHVSCGSQFFLIHCVTNSNIIIGFNIRKISEESKPPLFIAIFDKEDKKYNIQSFIEYIDNLIEENKLKDLYTNPCWNFQYFVKQLKSKFLGEEVYFLNSSFYKQGFINLLDNFDSWKEVESIPYILENQSCEILSFSDNKLGKNKISIFRYKYKEYYLNFVFLSVYLESKGIKELFELIVEPNNGESKQLLDFLFVLKQEMFQVNDEMIIIKVIEKVKNLVLENQCSEII